MMRSPDGADMPHDGVFLEVVPNRKIVVTDAFKPGWTPEAAFMLAIVTFDPEGSGTRYTARVQHWSEGAMKQHEKRASMRAGASWRANWPSSPKAGRHPLRLDSSK
jgi:uncharacterized protein YndB with AHSA1/START domain